MPEREPQTEAQPRKKLVLTATTAPKRSTLGAGARTGGGAPSRAASGPTIHPTMRGRNVKNNPVAFERVTPRRGSSRNAGEMGLEGTLTGMGSPLLSVPGVEGFSPRLSLKSSPAEPVSRDTVSLRTPQAPAAAPVPSGTPPQQDTQRLSEEEVKKRDRALASSAQHPVLPDPAHVPGDGVVGSLAAGQTARLSPMVGPEAEHASPQSGGPSPGALDSPEDIAKRTLRTGSLEPGRESQPGSSPDGSLEDPRTGSAAGATPGITPGTEDQAAKDKPDGKESEALGERAALSRSKKEEQRLKIARNKNDEIKRRHGKLTVARALNESDENYQERVSRSFAALRRAREKERLKTAQKLQSNEKVVRDVAIPDTILVADLANRMAEQTSELVKALLKMGILVTGSQSIDGDTAELLVHDFGHRGRRVSDSEAESMLGTRRDDPASLRPRPPIVTVMGHVDHGKTTLLDVLRRSRVAEKEAGGITQHIGAYQINVQSAGKDSVKNSGGDSSGDPGGEPGKAGTRVSSSITFLDTPGHAAFTSMRARGAQLTDIVVLVIAADDGIQPQTIEAIDHAKAAKVPVIVALNKCDKPDANPDKIRLGLLEHGLVLEEQGGETLSVEIAAKEGQNLDKLLEAILLQAELMELRANPDAPADGTVLEARLEMGRGVMATLLVQRGHLRKGGILVAGTEWGRIRAMVNEHGKPRDKALPGEPVEVQGFQEAPQAGDRFYVVENEATAREIVSYRRDKHLLNRHAIPAAGTNLEQLFSKMQSGEKVQFPYIVKGDVRGSVEAIVGALEKLNNDQVHLQLVHSGVGGITESDVSLASTLGGTILGFNVRANPQARQLAKKSHVDIRYYAIVYEILDDIRRLLTQRLRPERREQQLGLAEIRETFDITKFGKIAGCYVAEGLVRRRARARLLRNDVVVYEGNLRSLRRFKEEANEVRQGLECGLSFEHYDDVRPGDKVECYEIRETAAVLD